MTIETDNTGRNVKAGTKNSYQSKERELTLSSFEGLLEEAFVCLDMAFREGDILRYQTVEKKFVGQLMEYWKVRVNEYMARMQKLGLKELDFSEQQIFGEQLRIKREPGMNGQDVRLTISRVMDEELDIIELINDFGDAFSFLGHTVKFSSSSVKIGTTLKGRQYPQASKYNLILTDGYIGKLTRTSTQSYLNEIGTPQTIIKTESVGYYSEG